MGSRTASPFRYLIAPVRARIVLAGILSGAGAICGLLPVLAVMSMAQSVTPAIDGGAIDSARLWTALGALVVGVVVSHILTRAAYVVSHRADAALAESLRQQQIGRLLRLPLDGVARIGTGRVKKLVQDDVAKIHHLIAHVVPDTVDCVVRPVASVAMLFLIDWRIGLIGLIPLVLALASFPLFARFLATQFDRYNAALGDLGAATVEFVRGIEPIKLFQADGRGYRRFHETAVAHHRFYSEWMKATILGSALLMVFISPAFAIAVSTVGTALWAMAGAISPILMIPAILLAANVAGPLFQLVQMRMFLREAQGAAVELTEFLDAPEQAPATASIDDADPGMRVDDVSFRYPEGPLALEDVTLDLPAGTVTALVGRSGSGKSTLAALLPRLRDPDTGTVLLGGVDVRQLVAHDLYRHVGFVLQQPYLLRLSVHDNIALARPDATRDEVIAAARTAQIHERILRLPRGYDSVIGEEAQLSGGEEQRVSIARAVLQDARVLVLDEATAYADPDSEAAIQRALAAVMKDRTLVVIAHRLHTITGADRIVVLDAGRVIEQGTHEELLAIEGHYAQAWSAYDGARTLADHPADRRLA